MRRSAVDSKLLSLARKSPVEIGELTGLEPGFVAERISQLLESRDWLSDRQQERLLLEEIADLKDMVMDQVRMAGDVGEFAQVASVALRTLKLISERLDSRRKIVESDLQELQASQARLFGQAFDIALSSVIDKLLPDVEADVVDAVVADSLRLAAVELDKSIVDS